MTQWKKEYISNQLYTMLEMLESEPEEEPTVESLLKEVEILIERIKE